MENLVSISLRQHDCSEIEPETLLHLFYKCRIIRVIWNDVTDWISSKLRIPLSFGPSKILFGVEEENNHAKLNFCIVPCIRFYIPKTRISSNSQSTYKALLYFRTVCLSEKKICSKKTNRNYITTIGNGCDSIDICCLETSS